MDMHMRSERQFDPFNLAVTAEVEHGVARTIKHIGYAFVAQTDDVQAAVVEYLRRVADALGIPDAGPVFEFLLHGGRDDRPSPGEGFGLRWVRTYPHANGRVLLLQQTFAGVDVEAAGLRFVVESGRGGGLIIRGVISTLRQVELVRLDAVGVDTEPAISDREVNAVLKSFGFDEMEFAAETKIT